MGVSGAVMVPHPPIIIPDIGKGEEKKIQGTIDAYHQAARRIASWKPDTIVLLSPHQIMYGDYFHISPGTEAHGDFGQFGAGSVAIDVTYDTEFVEELCRQVQAQGLKAGTLGEKEKRLDHGTMVPLYFVNQYWKDYQLVRIGLSGLTPTMHYELGQCIQETANILGRNIAVIGSGDLSHRLKEDGPYGYQKEGPEFDRRIMEVMGSGDFEELLKFPEDFCETAGECGHRSFIIMAGTLDRMAVKAQKLSYEGPFGVGYGVCCYEAVGTDEKRNFLDRYEESEKRELLARHAREDAYVALARRTIEEYEKTGVMIQVPKDLPKELYDSRAGAFVSIKEDGRLRGCIGTIEASYESLAEEIINNAVSACSRDPRFSPVEPKELEKLVITVDVLGKMEQITSLEELDVKRYGVVVSKDSRRGLLLPNLAGVNSVEQQVTIAMQKAGIGEQETVAVERFEVVRHE